MIVLHWTYLAISFHIINNFLLLLFGKTIVNNVQDWIYPLKNMYALLLLFKKRKRKKKGTENGNKSNYWFCGSVKTINLCCTDKK